MREQISVRIKHIFQIWFVQVGNLRNFVVEATTINLLFFFCKICSRCAYYHYVRHETHKHSDYLACESKRFKYTKFLFGYFHDFGILLLCISLNRMIFGKFIGCWKRLHAKASSIDKARGHASKRTKQQKSVSSFSDDITWHVALPNELRNETHAPWWILSSHSMMIGARTLVWYDVMWSIASSVSFIAIFYGSSRSFFLRSRFSHFQLERSHKLYDAIAAFWFMRQ